MERTSSSYTYCSPLVVLLAGLPLALRLLQLGVLLQEAVVLATHSLRLLQRRLQVGAQLAVFCKAGYNTD